MIYNKVIPIRIYLVIFIFLTLVNCEKNDRINTDYTWIEISFISGMGSFTYENGLITSIGSEMFLYDENDNLIGTRSHSIDTLFGYNLISGQEDTLMHIHEKLFKYSYLLENSQITGRAIDSIMNKTITDGEVSNLSLLTNIPSAAYYYSGERLDSILIYKSVDESSIGKVIYTYNEQGNISSVKEYYYPQIQDSHLKPSISVAITEYLDYDDKLNPYNILFKQCGVILNKLEGKNFSKNNPLSSKTRFEFNGDWLEVNNTFNYEYLNNGLPTKLIVNKSTSGEMTTNFEYK